MSFTGAVVAFTPAPYLSQDKLEMIKSYYHGKHVLVTGGCGFIGSHLAEQLVSFGAHVTILDNLSTGFLENIDAIHDQVTFIQGDICDKKVCAQAVEKQDFIFHLAAYLSVPGSVKDPELCHEINIDGTFNLLEAARTQASEGHKISRFVFSSSCAVYGPYDGICTESTECNPLSPYGFSKWQGELLCKQFDAVFDIPTVILRYFNVYGPRVNISGPYAAVVAKFNDLMEQNEPVTIFGDGTQSRDFVPVKTVVQANLLLGILPESQTRKEIFNIGTGKSITVTDIFDALKKEHPDYLLPPQFAPARPGDVKHVYANCDKYKKLMQ